MAELSKSDYENKYNNGTTGLFKDNTTEDIEAVDVRAEVEDTADSFVNRLDEMALFSVSTAGATIILTFGNGVLAYQRRFVGSASFATPKTIELDFNTNANYFSFIFTITDVAATLTFDSDFKSSDPRWSSLVFTALEIGTYKAVAYKGGSDWYIDFSELPYV